MLRAGFNSSSRALLSRHITSSKRNEGQHLMRHFVTTDIISGTHDDERKRRGIQPINFNAMAPLSSTLGLRKLHPSHGHATNAFAMPRRNFSSTPVAAAPLSPEAAMEKFELTAISTEKGTAVNDAVAVWEATWWPQDQMVNLIVNLQEATGWNYALTIGALTLGFRTMMVPLFVKAQQNSSRMAHVKPEMDVLKTKIDRLDPKDLQGQQKYAREMQALFRKYDVNPLKAILVPIIQMPVFMSMFFALRNMPDIYPEKLADGGILWFTDLTAADPYGILPVTSAASFLLMMELGKEQMMASNPAQGQLMINFFRGIAVVMIPITYTFSTAIFCYWTSNNTFSLLQSVAFQNKSIKKALGIWDPPKPIPGAPPPKGMKEMFNDMMDQKKKSANNEKEKIKMHNASIEAEAGRKRRRGRGNGSKKR